MSQEGDKQRSGERCTNTITPNLKKLLIKYLNIETH